MEFSKDILNKYNEWTQAPFDPETQEAVKKLKETSPNDFEDAFYKNLEFGTGGMRGVMGIGSNRINKYTLGKNTQGLSQYLHQCFPNEELKVVIAYDCRNNSKELAQIVANVFSANQIKVYLFSDLRPTPELSFALKYLKCQAGVVLTASHNPPEYNGYKVYWQDGGQLVPPQDKEIIQIIDSLEYSDILFDAKSENIEFIDEEIDVAFWDSAIENATFSLPKGARENLKIVFTSLHGTSITAIPQVLKKAGYTNVHIVEEQAKPDGNFPTVKSPNPEEPEALSLALQKAEEIGADLVIGTDPDADRLGIAIRNNENRLVLLNGNQTMVVMTAFLLEQWKKQGKITGNEFIGTTIVSTPMMFSLAEAYGVECKVGLTGFKWIAKMIKDFPDKKFIGGGEESFGYMVGDAVRDKDSVASSLLFAEIAALTKHSGSSVYKELENLYLDYGYFKEHLVSITKKGMNGAKEIEEIMTQMRNNPKKELAGERIVFIEDYQSSIGKNMFSNETESLTLPKSNVLIYYLEDGSKICARPSGTEPKIKFYFSSNMPIESIDEIQDANIYLQDKIEQIINDMNIL